MGCFYCDEHHEGREAIMFKVGDMVRVMIDKESILELY